MDVRASFEPGAAAGEELLACDGGGGEGLLASLAAAWRGVGRGSAKVAAWFWRSGLHGDCC
jgi:hypothetical protein